MARSRARSERRRSSVCSRPSRALSGAAEAAAQRLDADHATYDEGREAEPGEEPVRLAVQGRDAHGHLLGADPLGQRRAGRDERRTGALVPGLRVHEEVLDADRGRVHQRQQRAGRGDHVADRAPVVPGQEGVHAVPLQDVGHDPAHVAAGADRDRSAPSPPRGGPSSTAPSGHRRRPPAPGPRTGSCGSPILLDEERDPGTHPGQATNQQRCAATIATTAVIRPAFDDHTCDERWCALGETTSVEPSGRSLRPQPRRWKGAVDFVVKQSLSVRSRRPERRGCAHLPSDLWPSRPTGGRPRAVGCWSAFAQEVISSPRYAARIRSSASSSLPGTRRGRSRRSPGRSRGRPARGPGWRSARPAAPSRRSR